MKHLLLGILSLLATPLLAQQADKVKPQQAAPPPAAQKYAAQPTQAQAKAAALGQIVPQLSDINDKSVTLRWNNPEPMDGIFDDFEGHADFVINSLGTTGWQYIDADNANTYTWTAAAFPNQGQKMAFIVFNPSKTSPSTGTYPDIQPFSGNKMLVDLTVDGGNNDFIISPELHFNSDFQISFRAKSYKDSWGLERFKVGYSTTGTRPSDFTFVQGGDYAEAPVKWTLFKYSIPKEAKYVCINCVSNDAFMFLLDDIFVGTNKVRPRIAPRATTEDSRLAGFNLLRDGVKVNNELITSVYATDVVPQYGNYTYTVQSVMTDGSTGNLSQPLQVEVPDIRLLPFFDNFDDNTIDSTLWKRPVSKASEENKWKSDYYAYGLVDFSACYPYSSMGAYDQSLVTRELNTQHPDNTWLRYEVRLDYDLKYASKDAYSVLATEITTDGGKTWTQVDSIKNDCDSFTWRTFEFPLSKYLNGQNLFQVRFRAWGNDSRYVNYWFVDDVKVWNPATHATTIKAMNGGSPVANCLLTLKGDQGAIYTATTDAQGNISLPRMEEGTYTVTAEAVGYNYLTTEWQLTDNGPATFTAQLTRPVLNISEPEVKQQCAMESLTQKTIQIENTGDGDLQYNFIPAPQPQSGDASHRWDITHAFDASGDLQSCVAFDGQNFFTSSSFFLGKFYKYDREGHFIEEFSVPGMYYAVNDMCFDGRYFYASDRKNRIFELDLRNKRLVSTIDIPSQADLCITHIAHDTRNDEFWVGDYNTLGRVNRKGEITVALYKLSTLVSMDVFGTAFDNVTPGGPYLWMSDLVTSGLNTIDKVTIKQYDLNNRRVVGESHSAVDIPGYKTGSLVTGENSLLGMECTTALVDGKLSLVGILQQSPSRVFAYTLDDYDSWMTASPLTGTLKAGEKQNITFNFDARSVQLNEPNTTTLQFTSIPTLTESHDISVSLTANQAAALPRPTQLSAVAQGESQAALTWQAAQGSQPTGYAIYRNDQKIGQTTETTYTDSRLVRGSYAYAVQALYGDQYSSLSDTVNVNIKVGEPYFAPNNLQADIQMNQHVNLRWDEPSSLLKHPAMLRYDKGRNDDAIGITEGGYFYAGISLDADALAPYRGMQLDSVQAFIKERVTSLSVRIYKDGKVVSTTRINPDDVKYGEFDNFKLKSPITIERGSTYYVTLLVAHDANLRPMGVQSGTPIDGVSNIMSLDGSEWFPTSFAGFEDANFNVAAHLSPAAGYTEVQPTGYIIYRNGEQVGQATQCQFTEDVAQTGVYNYTIASTYEGGLQSSPSAAVSVERIALDAPQAPATVNTATVRNRQVNLRWSIPMAQACTLPVDLTPQTGISPEGYPEYVGQFKGAYTGEMGIASDGKYIYTTKYSSTGIINRYHMDGTFDTSFTLAVPSNLTTGFRNLTYDGKQFYATANGSTLYVIDMDKQEITDEISISEIGRHIAYIPNMEGGRGGFEVGDWKTSIYTSLRGAKLGTGPTLNGAAGSAYYNGVIYTFEQGYNNKYELCAYDYATGTQLWHTSVANYAAIRPGESASAGGMTVIHTAEGYELLTVALQERTGTRYLYFDLGSVKGLSGYNIYRNGTKLNDAPIAQRAFTDNDVTPGTYNYEVETVYIDGTTSARTTPVKVTITEAGEGDAPTDVRARMASYGYDVNVTMVDPTTLTADTYESFEDQPLGQVFSQTGWVNKDGLFKTTADDAVQGSHSLRAEAEDKAELIIPVGQSYNAPFVFSFIARNGLTAEGNGELQVLSSADDTDAANFINRGRLSTTEAWQQFNFTLPADVKYIILRVNNSHAAQYIDAISINSNKLGEVYGYDIYRDGVKLNAEPVAGPNYTDHNLLPGTYNYQVVAYYNSSAISPKSKTATVNVSYTNGYQQPGTLSVEQTAEGNLLTWSVPALGEATELRWHNGVCDNAAGLPNGGQYYAGVEWSTDDLKPYDALSVSEVKFYINQVPDVLYVQLYEDKDLVFEKYATNLRQYAFNTIRLDKPFKVDASKKLRVVIYVEHNSITVPLGYDAGPAQGGKGNLYSTDGTTWTTLSDNDIEGNWNISVMLQPYADNTKAAPTHHLNATSERYVAGSKSTAEVKTLQGVALDTPQSANFFSGYNIYCNGERINESILSTDATTYLDADKHAGRYYEYQVKAIYPDYGEVGSNVVRVMVTGIDAVKADNNNSSAPVYNLKGIRTNRTERGPVIVNGQKRLLK